MTKTSDPVYCSEKVNCVICLYFEIYEDSKELLAIRRIFSLVDMITDTNFSNYPNVFKIGVVWQ